MTEETNPFKDMESNEDAPKHLKEKVMRDVNYLKFMTDVADLFSFKYAETVQTLFQTEVGKEEGKKLQ